MSDNTPQDPSADLKQAASDTVRAGVDIHDRVRDITLLALQNHRFDRSGIRDVVRGVTEGVALGAEGSRVEMREALSEALRGIDQALVKSAQAGADALKQLATTGKDFSESELKQSLANLKKLEDDFIATVSQVAEAANERVRPELRELIGKTQRTGTETGKHLAITMTEFAHRFSVASIDTTIAGLEAASEFGTRFAMLASGMLAGMADALRERKTENQDSQKAG